MLLYYQFRIIALEMQSKVGSVSMLRREVFTQQMAEC